MATNKRTNSFQGRPENPYDEREDEPADPPQKATAAQMASRKIRSAKGSRRPAGTTSGISMQSNNFAFGGADASASSTASPFGFGSPQPEQPSQNGGSSGNLFGGGATNSFPPTQQSAPGNNFSSSSFPSFGGNGTNTTFTPQPPSAGFSFTAGASNPFAASTPAPTMNGSANGGAYGGSIFKSTPSQPAQSNSPFAFGTSGTSSAAPTGGMFGTSGATSTAPTNNIFGSSNAPATNMFGSNTASSAPSNAPATATATAAPANPFGKLASAPSSTPSTMLSFGSSQSGPAATQESAPKPAFNFLGSASVSAAPLAPSSPAPASTPFSLFGAKTQGESTSTPATSKSMFQGFGASTQGESASTPVPTTNMFGAKPQSAASSTPEGSLFQKVGTSTQGDTASTPAPKTPFFTGFATNSGGGSASPSAATPSNSSNLFSKATPAAKPANPTGSFLTGSQNTKQTQAEATSDTATAKSPLLMDPATEKGASATSTNGLFASAPKSTFGGFGSTPKTDKPAENTPAKSNMFSFSTPQTTFKAAENTTKEPESTAPKTSTFTQSGTGSGIFAQSFAPGPGDSSTYNFSSSNRKPTTTKSTPSLFAQAQPASSKPDDTQKTSFSFTQANSSSDQNKSQSFFSGGSTPTNQQPPLSPASSMPTLTGAAAPPREVSKAGEVPKIPRYPVPGGWGTAQATDTDLHGLAVQLVTLNNQYRTKLAALPAAADWTPLSKWHVQATANVMQKITAAKKQAAAAQGITGTESSLSVKRKASAENDAIDRVYDASPTKKPRAAEAPTTPISKVPSLFNTTPKATPPPSETSSLFGSVLSKGTNATASEKKDLVPAKTPAAQIGSSFANTTSVRSSKPTGSQSLFQMPSASSGSKTSVFGGSLLTQFKAKSYEELVAERKSKDKDEDYDSDDDYDEWSAEWDRKEAERLAKQKEAATRTTDVSAPPKTSNGGLNFLSSFAKPAGATSGASTPGLLGSRVGSPAASTESQSIFDTPDSAQSPASNNIFGHLSAGPSSNQDDEEEEEKAEESYDSGIQSTTEPNLDQAQLEEHKSYDSESESEESLEETMRRKKQDTTKKPSLADRMTRDARSKTTDESEKENGDPNKTFPFGQSNGVQTPANKPFSFFDFDSAAGAKTAPPKQDTFAGDQTFKAGSPIKFGTTVKGNPSFQFQPATPGVADFSSTPSKPATSTFSFLNAASSSTPGSGLSTRAQTPLSETEASGKESAADNDDEEGARQDQLDLSGLTEDEKVENDILFHADQALCKHQVVKSGGEKGWDNYARGPLWILKNKESGKAFVRMRLSSGTTKLNYNILPKLKTNVTGNSKKMVNAMGTKDDGKTGNIFFALKSSEIATEFSNIYNDNLPA